MAPALFCIAIDWILSQVASQVGITVGDQCFTDLAYADDAMIFLSDEDQTGEALFQCTDQRGCSIWSKDVMDQNKGAEFGKWAPLVAAVLSTADKGPSVSAVVQLTSDYCTIVFF